jgi:hypothetical protein
MLYNYGIVMDTRLLTDIERYVSYGWGNSIITSLIRYRYNADIRPCCINNVRSHRPCKDDCCERCTIKHITRWCRPYIPQQWPR